MRKIVSVVALLFVFGVAFLSKPATALMGCNCGGCVDAGGVMCADFDEHKVVTCTDWLSRHMC
jgi:hypothetical protein